MCVAILQPAGQQISNTRFDRCWKRNKDGGGFAFPDKQGNVLVSKGYFDLKQMRKAYRQAVKENPDVPFVVHFRIATQGTLDESNTHPFSINNGLVMAHNGHITGWGNKELSDTHQFVLKVLARLPEGFHRDPVMQELIRGYLHGDKVVFLDAAGQFVIVNEKLGHWDNGIWYSNTSFRKPKPYLHQSWKGHGSSAWWPSKDEVPGDDVVDATTYEFCGLKCALCKQVLDEEDDEFCFETAALEPVCLDCLQHFGITSLLTDGLIQWYDEKWDFEEYTVADEDKLLPATSLDDDDYSWTRAD